MGFADLYFSKQKGFRPYFHDLPSPGLKYTVVIPAYREPDIVRSLECLWRCTRPTDSVEVIVVMNRPENAGPTVIEQTRNTAHQVSEWIEQHSTPEFRFLLIPELVMPVKDAGVGLARKSGMDQALYRFNQLDKPEGVIMGFDADSCCTPDYFTAIADTLSTYPRTRGFNLYFEHPLSGNEGSDMLYAAITAYELHLRVMNLFIRYTGFPHAYHTIGSCFGVRADTYAREGGMNKRKAGEDFYFLQKIIPLGEFREINTTCVIPSPRVSDRVPFGTGAAMGKCLASPEEGIMTYHPCCFYDLKALFTLVPRMYHLSDADVNLAVARLPESIHQYLTELKVIPAIREINANSGSATTFENRFFRWFDAFRIIKFLNFATRQFYGSISVQEAVKQYFRETGLLTDTEAMSEKEMLLYLRALEKNRR